VVDGRVGFTGGVGIASEWTGDAEDADHWRDDHFQFDGPVVRYLQGAFVENWSFEINVEIAVAVFGSAFVEKLDASFEEDLHNASEITLEEVEGWSWLARARDQVARLVREQL
jgi:phosphatidylserine/phosphatidylglycerophosphate/cardiolipin synthase-like enzyme